MNTNLNNRDEKPNYELCNVCGSYYNKANRARHIKTRKHRDCDYINNNRFEIERIKPKREEKNEIIIIK
jgi:hypothetical protein